MPMYPYNNKNCKNIGSVAGMNGVNQEALDKLGQAETKGTPLWTPHKFSSKMVPKL